MKIAAIIQARLGSTRLPNKIFMDIEGKPILAHVIDRAREALENVIVATPDEEVAKFAIKQGVLAFVGSQDDVLDRYYKAATFYEVENIVRLTADNPLYDPEVIKKVVYYYFTHEYDYVSNIMVRTYPKGLDTEVFTYNTLYRAWHETKEPYDREHVTPYIYNNPKKFKLGEVRNDIDLSYLRWTVDTPEDLEYIRQLFKEKQCVQDRK